MFSITKPLKNFVCKKATKYTELMDQNAFLGIKKLTENIIRNSIFPKPEWKILKA